MAKRKSFKNSNPFGTFLTVIICLSIGYAIGVNNDKIPQLKTLFSNDITQGDLWSKTKQFVSNIELSNPKQSSTASPDEHTQSDVDQIKIASFNIRILSDNSRDDTELQYIAKILSLYDIIAIQEVRDTRVLDRLVRILGNKYEYDASPAVGRGVKEIYAFMWRKDRVKQLVDGKIYPDVNDDFIREPYYATFKAGNFDFTLLTIHVFFGKSEKERRPELVKLAEVYQYVQRKDENENDVILLGDFNMSASDNGWSDLKDIQSMQFIIQQTTKTTITDTSSYDNMWFQSNYTTEFSKRYGLNKFDETMFNGDDEKAKITVSDHRPIWAIFDTKKDDD